MELTGNRIIATDRQTVWHALNDVEVLKACITGCKEMTGSVEDGFEAVVTAKVGPVKATFKGAVTLSDIVESEAIAYRAKAKGAQPDLPRALHWSVWKTSKAGQI